MSFFVLEPEVAGGFGQRTLLQSNTHPPIVTYLHFELQGWLGDELLEVFPCYVVTESLGKRLREARLTGFEFASIEVTQSPEADDLLPGTLPVFVWLKINGRAGIDSFGISIDNKLVVSQDALNVMRLSHCDISVFHQ
jgi:hypothetical protein